ncbi:MAG: DNA-protecting protein DprA [Actinomycetota bacterium]|nr:DNA-protecting protein DprA [Actinomycetota bacterium]
MAGVSDGVAERRALIRLAHGVEPGDARIGRLVAESGAVAALARLRDTGRGSVHLDGIRARLASAGPDDPDARATEVGAAIVTRLDRDWPSQLDDLGHQAPFALWVSGAASLRLLALRSVAVVGARACTAYGEEVARSWSAELGGERWSVLSGGAYGIDAAAHRGALAAGGTTICVLAGGVDMPYPRAHDALIARIADEGLVVSESPPGESVRRQRFLSRNRLIAALSRATLVVEAAARSGTIATARAAAAMNRPVLAVPGPVTSPASAGCHRMIRDGDALLVESPGDVLDLLDLSHASHSHGPVAPDPRPRDGLAARERTVLDAVPSRGTVTAEALAAAAAVPIQEAWAALGVLEAGGWVLADAEGWRLARLTPRRRDA